MVAIACLDSLPIDEGIALNDSLQQTSPLQALNKFNSY